jgi:hypothetical protein
MQAGIEIGTPEGRTRYSRFADERYEKRRHDRDSLSSGEFTLVMEGYLHEWSCMGMCNLYIQGAKDPDVKRALETYRHDVCEPNLTELTTILKKDGYKLPQPYNAESESKSVEELGTFDGSAMSDAQIAITMIFGTQGFMNHWNMGTMVSKRTDVREAFRRNWHRANRWNEAYYDLAVEKGYLMPLPTMDAKGLMRTTVMGA